MTPFTPIPDDLAGGGQSYKRITHVLCYDKGMALYIVVFLAWVVWMGLGVTKRLFGGEDYNDIECDDLTGYMSTSIACGYVYMSLVSLADGPHGPTSELTIASVSLRRASSC